MDELKLEMFMSMARYLSFTRAAEDCHVVQATMSKQMALLEEDLGVQLFVRDHHSVTLTPAGQRLRANVENYVSQYRNINASLHKLMLELDEGITVGIGFFEAVFLEEPFRRFRRLSPSTDITCMYYSYSQLVSRVSTSAVDIAFGNSLCAKVSSQMTSYVLRHEPYYVAAAGDSDFWGRSRQEQSYLTDQVVITTLNNEYEPVRPFCTAHNMRQKAFTFSNNMPAQLALVKSNLGIALLPASMRPILPPGVRMENVLAAPMVVDSCIIYNDKSGNAALHRFVDVCKTVYPESARAAAL